MMIRSLVVEENEFSFGYQFSTTFPQKGTCNKDIWSFDMTPNKNKKRWPFYLHLSFREKYDVYVWLHLWEEFKMGHLQKIFIGYILKGFRKLQSSSKIFKYFSHINNSKNIINDNKISSDFHVYWLLYQG